MMGAGGTAMGWADWVESELVSVREAGRWRAPRPFDAKGPEGLLVEGARPVVSFASNDYLGLTRHPGVVAAAHAALDRWGTGAGAARLIVGSRPVHAELESALAQWRGTDAALVFPTGYTANLGVLSTVGGPGVTILSDALNHASIIDGCRLARAGGATVEVFGHRDLAHLEELLGAATGRTVVVSDTVFSMDGDPADVDGLVRLAAAHDALLVLDEAHAVLGPDVPVPPRRPGADHPPVLRVGTLSKALGSQGGFVAGPRRWIDLLVNRSRSWIFTTALSPADSAAALAALQVVRSPEGEDIVRRLRAHVDRLSPGWPSPILPLVVGDEARALDASAQLLTRGLLVPAIRPPTVPPGTSRLRIALSAAHTPSHLDQLAHALAELGLAVP
jgi:8-amino-7-oxononanoate synthase